MDQRQPHFVLIPLLAQGHMIPMIDMARLISARGVFVTIVTTTLTASRVKATIDRAVESGLQIRLLQLPFPYQEAGLPEGCESLDAVTSIDMVKKFCTAIDMLQQPVEHFLEHIEPRPSCIISDTGMAWACETSQKFHVPRLAFHGMCCFALLCTYNLRRYNTHEKITSDTDPFAVPDLPHLIELTKPQLPGQFSTPPELKSILDEVIKAELTADGVVVNSFEELEPEYFDNYQKATGKKAWAIGPVSLCDNNPSDRGHSAAENQSRCLSWLDSKKLKSVVYVCFGSMCRFTPRELMEMGLGLDASNQSFIWVIRNDDNLSKIETWLKEEFEERVKERGLVIRGWAPQILILQHPAVGGFLTHCGWNSTLEGICAGLPMITWPLSAEQFLNEKLVTHVLKIGVSVGSKTGLRPWQDRSAVEIVKSEDVKKAVELLMDGEEAEERRTRAWDFGEKARRAVQDGGSSHISVTRLIKDVTSGTHGQWPKQSSTNE